MRNIYKTLLVLSFSVFSFNTTVNAQNFTDTLETVYLNQSPEFLFTNSSYSLLNKELIAMKTINFSKEIRLARKQKTALSIDNDKNVLKSKYLKILRFSANNTENINAFYTLIYKKLPVLKSKKLDESTLSKLYITVKNNTLHGKLENTGKELSWL
jgi:hypothetical protein